MVYTRTKIALLASSLLLLPLFVSAVPQNYTIDDSDQVTINYWEDQQWSHDPLAGYQQFFVNGTRSYTYVPGAAALFNFTGTGIYLQGPYSSDMALRSVTLDGQDMGTFAAYSPERLPTVGTSAVFWGKGGLTNTLHTVAVAHADTADKILVMDAWIYEADSSQSPQGTGTITAGITAGAVVSSPTSTSGPNSNSNSTTSSTTTSSSSTVMSKTPLIIGITIPLLLLLFCIAGFCLFRRRHQRNAQRQHDAIKEKMFPSSSSAAAKNPMRLSQPVYPVSAPGYSSSESNAELASAGAAVPRSGRAGGGGGGVLPSHPFHNRPRAASDTYNNNEDSLGLSNHPLFIPTPITSRAASDSSDSHYPTPPPYAGAPMLFFEQRPDPIPPLNSDYAPQPIVNASPPTSPSIFRRLSTSIAGVIPGITAAAAAPVRSLSRNSNGGGGEGGRRTSVLTDFRYNTTTSTSPRANNNLGLDIGRTASPRSRDRDAYLPYPPPHYLPSSPIPRSPNYQFSSYSYSPNTNSIPIPLSPISAISTGFARQSANLGDLKFGDLKYETSNLSTADTLHTLNTSDDVKTGDLMVEGGRELTVDGGVGRGTGTGVESTRGSKADPFDDEYAFSSYTRLTRDEVMRSRPVSSISANNPQ